MEKLNFEVGQLAEMRTFEHGFRGAWFRCKIKEILLKKNKIWLEYYDFDSEELSWEQIYQVPPYLRKSKPIKKQLMVRPQYPEMCLKSEMPAVSSISQPCVIIDGTWKVGDLVDWFEEGCYWSARVVKLLSDDKVQVELPMPPLGEGKEGEEGKHEAFCDKLRPSLVWSETEGWTFPEVEGHTSCGAQLIFPTKQGVDLKPEPAAAGSTTCVSAEGDRYSQQTEKSMKMDCDLGMDLEPEPVPNPEPAAAGSTTCKSGEGDRYSGSEQTEKSANMDCDLDMDLEPKPGPGPAAAGSTTRKSDDGDRDSEQNEKSVKMDCDLMESSESTLSLQKKVVAADEVEVEKRDELNIMHEQTLEAAVLDLQELVAKVKWMQRLLLHSPTNDAAAAATSSWKFA